MGENSEEEEHGERNPVEESLNLVAPGGNNLAECYRYVESRYFVVVFHAYILGEYSVVDQSQSQIASFQSSYGILSRLEHF